MLASCLISLRAILPCCILVSGLAGWCQSLPMNLPEPPPLPPSLKDRQLALPPDLPDPSELQLQLQQLGELLNMDPEKLNKLRQTIEFVERMSPAEREAMRIRISQVTRATPELSREVNQLARLCPLVNQADLSQYWLAASQSERQRVRAELDQLNQQQRASFLENKVKAFTDKRDSAFEEMRKSLEAKRKDLLEKADTEL